MRALALIAASLVAAGCGTSSMDRHLAASKADGKPLVVQFYTTWCGACKRFDETVLMDPTVERALEDVNYVRYDAESSSGRAQALRYGVQGFPTFVVVDGDGEAVAMIRGVPTPSRFVSFLEWGPVHALDEASLAALLDRDTSTRALLLAARFHATEGNLDTSVAYYDRVLTLLDDATRLPDITWERTLIASAGGVVGPLAEAAVAYATAYPRAAHMLDALGLAVLSGGLDDGAAHTFSRQLIAAVSDDASALNDITYTLLAADLLDVALESANAQLEITPDEANAWDTLAEVHHYRREQDRALVAADKAIELAPTFSRRAMFEENKRRYADKIHHGTSAVSEIASKTQTLLADLRIQGATAR